MTEKQSNDEQTIAHVQVISQEINRNIRPFDVCDNKLVWVDEKEIKYCNIVEDDLSQLMRDRINKEFSIQKYGIEIFPEHQINPIKCVWVWFRKIMNKIKNSENYLDNKTGKSYLLQWGNCINKQLNEIRMLTPSNYNKNKYFLGRNYVSHDHLSEIFKLLDWTDPKKPKLKQNSFKNLEDNQQYSRSAATFVFHFDYDNACQALTKAVNYYNSNLPHSSKNINIADTQMMLNILENMRNIAKMIHGDKLLEEAVNTKDMENFFKKQDQSFTEHWKRDDLSIKLTKVKSQLEVIINILSNLKFTDQYCEQLRLFIIQKDDPYEVIKNDKIAIYDRLAYILRFYSNIFDEVLIEFENDALKKGNLDAIVILGTSNKSVEVLQTYYDRTLDLQTTGLLGCVMAQLNLVDGNNSLDKYERFYSYYKDWLNRVELYKHRAAMDREHFELRHDFPSNKTENEKSLLKQFCVYCDAIQTVSDASVTNKHKMMQQQSRKEITEWTKQCPSCSSKLPQCSVCLIPIEIFNPFQNTNSQNIPKNKDQKKGELLNDTIKFLTEEKGLVWCQTCKHGGHAQHILKWFDDHQVCPISNCECPCNLL